MKKIRIINASYTGMDAWWSQMSTSSFWSNVSQTHSLSELAFLDIVQCDVVKIMIRNTMRNRCSFMIQDI